MGVLDIGLENAQLEEAVVVEGEAVAEEVLLLLEVSNLFLHLFQTSVTAVESLAILPRIVNFKKMPAITVAEVAILPRIARSPERSGSSAAITVANLATSLGTVIMQMSKNVILVESLATFKKTAPKSNATGCDH